MHHAMKDCLSMLVAAVVCVWTLPALLAATVHVSPAGNDANPGTAWQPVASMRKAMGIVGSAKEPCEIILHKGVYPGELHVGLSEDASVERPPLLITAAKGADDGFEEVVFDGGEHLDKAEPVAGKPGVYRAPATANGGHLWEDAARIRYEEVADLAAVEAFPASFWRDGRVIYMHTSDGRDPVDLGVGVSSRNDGIVVWRRNTTVRGIRFLNFLEWEYGGGVTLRAPDTTVEDCSAWNCRRAFQGLSPSGRVRILRCRCDDCAMGAYVGEGKGNIVHDCRFFMKRDRFVMPGAPQQRVGIKFYSTANGGDIRGNLCVGFIDGIFLKCGHSEPFVVEHNTVLDGVTQGVGGTSYNPHDIYRYNIIIGFQWPISCPDTLRPGTVVDYHCIFGSLEENALEKCRSEMRRAGAGEHNIFAAPRFAAPAMQDYRLLPGSPCLKAGPNGETCGALDAVGPDFKDTEPPKVTCTLGPPAKRAGGSGELYFERDPWNGGGRNLVRKLGTENPADEWITAEGQIGLLIDANDAAGKPARLKLRVGDGPWSVPEPYTTFKEVGFPDQKTFLAVSVAVADDSGNWSAPQTLLARRLSAGPKVKGKPVVYASGRGVVVSFETDAPCRAAIQYGPDMNYGKNLEQSQDVQHCWLPSEGGDWVTIRSNPRVTNYLVLLTPAVAEGKTYHYRLVLSDEIGNKTVTDDAAFTVSGPAKSYYVSPQGEDLDGRGAKDKPWRTIQFAVDRALPGDRILLLPGLYPGETRLTHGGLEDAPITIEAEEPGTVILDGRHEIGAPLRLTQAPDVSIQGLEIRWWAFAGVYVIDSPNVSISNCRIWNGLRASFATQVGSAVLARRSPGMVADHNVMYLFEQGIQLVQSPRARITYNTILMNCYGAVDMYKSGQSTVLRNNSFAYNGNQQYQINGDTPEEFATFDADYNNLCTQIGPSYIQQFKKESQGEALQGVVKDPFFKNHASKMVIWSDGKIYQGLKAWQQATGKDRHSIFADPLYLDAAHGDFHLQPGSPNIGAGENGTTIGALGVEANHSTGAQGQ